MSNANSTILVVEDEPLARALMIDLFEEADFDVLEARDGEKALALLAARSDNEAVFTDVEMPGKIDGVELARRVHASNAKIAIVIVSGRFVAKPRICLWDRGL